MTEGDYRRVYYHAYKDNPEKNKIVTFTLADIENENRNMLRLSFGAGKRQYGKMVSLPVRRRLRAGMKRCVGKPSIEPPTVTSP